jgi:hypothetical protein
MKKLCAIALLLCSTVVYSQTAGQTLSGFVPVLDHRNQKELTQVPLPAGEWMVARSSVRNVNGHPNAKLRDVSLLQVVDGKLIGAIEIVTKADDLVIRWNDEPCKVDSVHHKNDFGTKLWTQKCLTVNYSPFLQNDNDAVRNAINDLASKNIKHDFNAIRMIYTRFGDVGRFLIYRYFLFPSNYGLENPREAVPTASPYHPFLIDNHPDKKDFVSAVIKYAEDITPNLDVAYMGGNRAPFMAFSYSRNTSSADHNPASTPSLPASPVSK